jgi:hypothetical protein
MHVRERARLGAVALGAGAAVLALIQILEQSVSAFSPRPVVSALITAVVALVGVTLARARSVAQRRQFLANVLRQSPMPAAVEADPYMLGVFRPRTPVEDGIGPYVPRSVDDPLEKALAKNTGFVLLIGAPRAGKSRSVYEAVLRRLPRHKLLVPYGGEALPSIIGDTTLRSQDAVWWLDDLGRFLPSLDGPSLDELLNGDRLVVASVRAETWEALLKADGDAGEQARTLLAGAFTVHMTAEHTAEELAEAARLYPDLDLSSGIGPALTAEVPETREPIGRSPSHVETPRRFDPLLGLLLIATMAASVFLAGFIVGGGFSDKAPPPIASQVEQIVGDGYRNGKQLVYYNLDADLHGLNQQSWIFIWRSAHGSDDLRIYDDDGGRLKLRLDFPTGSGSDPGQIVSHKLLNVDGFFETELVGGYSTAKLWPAEIPFVVSWNEARRRYVLAPLLPKPVSSMLTKPKFGASLSAHLELAPSLLSPVRLAYRSGSSYAVQAYPADLHVVVPAKGNTSAVLAVAAQTTKKLHQLGLTTPAFAVAAFGLQPLISTDGVPKLSCVHPATDPSPVTTTSLIGETTDPFAPGSNTAPSGFQESGPLDGSASGLDLLDRRAKAADAPCDVVAMVGPPSIVQPVKKKNR